MDHLQAVPLKELMPYLPDTRDRTVDTSQLILPGSLQQQGTNRLLWLKSTEYYERFQEGHLILSQEDYKELQDAKKLRDGLVHYITAEETPRLVFARILDQFYVKYDDLFVNEVDKFRERTDIQIGENVFIGPDVEIGSGTMILHNVVIHAHTKMGRHCLIKENTTIGTEGLGYEYADGQWHKFPQFGHVEIGDEVVIGPHATIRKGALDATEIQFGAKIGSFVNIGHNCVIGKNSFLASQCVLAGSTVLGEKVYMGVQTSTRNGTQLGDYVTVGHGAVVTKSFPAEEVLVGNPAEPMSNFTDWRRIRKRLMEESYLR